MKDFVLLFRGGLDFTTASQEQLQQAMMKWKTWIDDLAKDEKFGGGERLTKNGAVLKGKARQIINGPFTESKEIVGGYVVVKADDQNAAIEISKSCPIFDYDGIVEVREVAKM